MLQCSSSDEPDQRGMQAEARARAIAVATGIGLAEMAIIILVIDHMQHLVVSFQCQSCRKIGPAGYAD